MKYVYEYSTAQESVCGLKSINPCSPQEIQATWYEKLHEWEDALVAYDKKMDTNKDDPELMLGRMRCLEALGEW